MFGNFQQKTVIRKVQVTAPAKPAQRAVPKPSTTSKAGTPLARRSSSDREPRQANTQAKVRSTNNSPQSTPRKTNKYGTTLRPENGSHPRTSSAATTTTSSRSTSLVKKAVKRKASTPPPQWDNTDSSDSDRDGSSDISSMDYSARKRVRSSASSVDPGRRLVDHAAFRVHLSKSRPGDTASTDTIEISEGKGSDDDFPLAHGADLVSGENAAKFMPAFREEEATLVELQYPSRLGKERFFLAVSMESDGYKTIEDISETVKYVAANYLGAEDREVHGDDGTGLERRLTRALNGGDLAAYVRTIDEYNDLIRRRLEDGTIMRTLSLKHCIDYGWMKRILDQVYSRTVSPHVEMLKEYKNGTDNVYGELLYPLVSEMFRETSLRSDQVFVDLGSGVGNVVLQAALEIGCESWGCEMMPNPCDLAELQAEEFPQRARLWGLAVGQVKLLRGDFLENKEIGDVLKRADVVLVNNQAFGPDLNSKLVDKFLDLKDGCQVVSLKSFKPEGFEIQERNVNDVRHLLRVKKMEYFSNRVSWTDAPGNYFIATKDPAALIRFQNDMLGRSRR